ncbi:hypothetical protein KAR02_01790, partial [Candidatus Bipolaricaulota bacterium]|nr:hypothetical protein [Candidatus Bipolaricaulota bacterium]
DCSGACEEEASGRMQGGFGNDATAQNTFGGGMGQNSGNEDMETMIGQRLGQDVDEDTIETMREQMKDRLEQMGDQVPEALIERLGERFSGVGESLDGRLGQPANASTIGQMGGRANVTAMSRQGGMDLRGQLDVNSISMQHMQTSRGQMGDHGNLFEFLERITDVLDLKLEAME